MTVITFYCMSPLWQTLLAWLAPAHNNTHDGGSAQAGAAPARQQECHTRSASVSLCKRVARRTHSFDTCS